MARLEDELPPGPFDLVASALCVHHLRGPEKRDLFARVRARLGSGGRFVLADVVVPVSADDAVTSLSPGFDHPSPLADQLEWLAEAGFSTSVAWQHRDLAVVVADRSSRRHYLRTSMTARAAAGFLQPPLAEVDPEIAEVLSLELERQQRTLEMIASENFAPLAVLECQGSVLTNKYAEGYPGKRYYGGCEYVDVAEQLAIDRALALFGGDHANVQPHSGAQANAAVYHALLDPGDALMGLELSHGGHLTHGMKINVSGRLYEIVAYHVDRETSWIDMDEVQHWPSSTGRR